MRRSTTSKRWLACTSALVVITLACSDEPTDPESSALEVTTLTTGAELDRDGYTLLVDNEDAGAIGTSTRIRLTELTPGEHRVELSGVAANCSVDGENPRTATTAAADTVRLEFAIACSPTTGSVRVTVTTSGPAPTNSYAVTLDGGAPRIIGPNQSLQIGGFAAGEHQLSLGLPDNCTAGGDNPRAVTVSPGSIADATFEVTCIEPPPPPPTGFQVTVTTTGSSVDADGYALALYGTPAQPIAINHSLTVSRDTGWQSVALVNVDRNCTVLGENPHRVTIAEGELVPVAFEVECRSPVVSPWIAVPSGTGFDLRSISGTSADNMFVAGTGTEPNCESFCGRGTLLHFAGSSWATQVVGTGSAEDVWAAPGGEAFALVRGQFPSPILHYDGSAWTPMPTPAITNDDPEVGLYAIWGTSATDVFVVGTASDPGANEHTFVAHYDGVAWTPMSVPDVPGTVLQDVWGTSSSDVWAVGTARESDDDRSDGVVYHYDGAAWSVVLNEPYLELTKVMGTSTSDVYAVGFGLVPTGIDQDERFGPGAIRHFDGVSWSKVQSPTSARLWAVWPISGSDVYLLASPGPGGGSVWHFDGTGWTQQLVADFAPLDIWGSASGELFTVGVGGEIRQRP